MQNNNYIKKEDFIFLFIAILSIKGLNSVNIRTLISFINYCKTYNKFETLLNDINLEFVDDSLYSKDIFNIIIDLSKNKLIKYKNEIVNFNNISISKFISNRIDNIDEVLKFTNEYIIFMQKSLDALYYNIYNEEKNNYFSKSLK